MRKHLSILTLSAIMLFAFAACSEGDEPAVMEQYASLPNGATLIIHTLESAKAEGFVVHEDGDITFGQSTWDKFTSNVEDGIPSAVSLAYHFTLNNQNICPELYEEIKNDYPRLFTYNLSFDGSQFILYSIEETEEYIFKFLQRFEEIPPVTATYRRAVRYVLVNDNEITWEQIIRSMISSWSGDFIAHRTVYTKLYN